MQLAQQGRHPRNVGRCHTGTRPAIVSTAGYGGTDVSARRQDVGLDHIRCVRATAAVPVESILLGGAANGDRQARTAWSLHSAVAGAGVACCDDARDPAGDHVIYRLSNRVVWVSVSAAQNQS